jgi:hypothetical protein
VPLGIWRAWTRQFLAGLLLFGAAQAQQQLVVNGVPVAGLTTEVVPGAAYAPVAAYARALGADYRVDPQAGVLLVFGGRILTLQSFGTPAEAAAATTALVRDGRRLPSSGAVQVAGTVYLPVKSVSAALGGDTAYLAEAGTVAVVFPRPRLLATEPPRRVGQLRALCPLVQRACKLRAPTSSRPSTWCAFAFLEPDWGARHWPHGALAAAALATRPSCRGVSFLDFNLTCCRAAATVSSARPTVTGSAWSSTCLEKRAPARAPLRCRGSCWTRGWEP